MKKNTTDTGFLAVGDRLSRVSYMEVMAIGPNFIEVKNQDGLCWKISNAVIAAETYTAAQYSEEVKCSRTELVEKLEGARDSVFTVVFNKKVNQKSMVEALSEIANNPDEIFSLSDLKSTAKSLMTGPERTLVGYLASTEPKMGRSTVVDLQVSTDKHRLRLVDHRTIKELVLRNVRYVLKS